MSAEIIHGDCLDVMRGMAAGSVDTIITDPPAGVSFMGKTWDGNKGGREQWVAWLAEIMAEGLRVLKPGGFALVWALPRTSHWTALALEDAGFEVRDCVYHLFGSGFPKSHDIAAALDKAENVKGGWVEHPEYAKRNGNGSASIYGQTDGMTGTRHLYAPATPLARAFHGYGTALKPAAEVWWVAMKPTDGTFAQNAAEHGVAGLWIDGARIEASGEELGRKCNVGPYTSERTWSTSSTPPQDGRGKGLGRWPANVCLDEEAAALLDEQSGERKSGSVAPGTMRKARGPFSAQASENELTGYGDTGGASRFFYCAKASRAERNAGLEGMEERKRDESRHADQPSMNGGSGNPYNRGAKPVANHHPTVKPIALMRWLARLTRPPHGGVVLDPFAGSGSTGVACIMEGRAFVGIELDADYVAIARERIAHAEREAAQLPLAIGAD